MKKFYYIVGAVVTAAGIFALLAVMLKKIKISLSIEGVDDVIEEEENDDITLTIENDEAEDNDILIREEIETMLEDDEEI
jgi:hypothetical protein